MYLAIFKQCSSNLAPEMLITNKPKWHLSCCCHDSSFAAGPVLIETEIPSFFLTKDPLIQPI